MQKRTFMQHWPVLLLGLVVVSIFLAMLVVFEVKETDFAVVMVFGSPRTEADADARPGAEEGVKVYPPGLHLKWPHPIATVWRHDKRLQCYELKKGQVEQVQTADDYQIVVTTYALWRVGDPGLFLKRVSTTDEAENKLDDVVRNSRNITLARHDLTELINTNPSQVRIPAIEQEILEDANSTAMSKYGIHIEHIGFKHLGFPQAVSIKVFDRMRAERRRKSEKYRAEGKRDAQKIRAQADLAASETLTAAEAEAKRIRAEGDKTAAEYYAAFRENPELAAFLRKLDSLRLTLSQKTTLVVDTNTPPYDLLLPGATDLEKTESKRKPGGQGDAK